MLQLTGPVHRAHNWYRTHAEDRSMTTMTKPVTCRLDVAATKGIPLHWWPRAQLARRVLLTDRHGKTAVQLRMTPAGRWYATDYRDGKTVNGYAGYHSPRRDGVPGLTALGIQRAVEAMDRQTAGPAPCCTECGRRLPR